MGKAIGHARHDLLEVTAAVDGGWLPTSAARCPTCTVLHVDLVALRRAIPAMAIPTRPRDLRLTAVDADRLRPTAWRRLVAAIGTSRDRLTRPLAVSFTGLGLAGLLLGTVPSSLPFGATATAGRADTAPQDAAATAELPVMQALPSMAPEVAATQVATSSGTPASTGIDPLAPGPLALLSLGLLGIGGGLFAVRRLAARPGQVR